LFAFTLWSSPKSLRSDKLKLVHEILPPRGLAHQLQRAETKLPVRAILGWLSTAARSGRTHRRKVGSMRPARSHIDLGIQRHLRRCGSCRLTPRPVAAARRHGSAAAGRCGTAGFGGSVIADARGPRPPVRYVGPALQPPRSGVSRGKVHSTRGVAGGPSTRGREPRGSVQALEPPPLEGPTSKATPIPVWSTQSVNASPGRSGTSTRATSAPATRLGKGRLLSDIPSESNTDFRPTATGAAARSPKFWRVGLSTALWVGRPFPRGYQDLRCTSAGRRRQAAGVRCSGKCDRDDGGRVQPVACRSPDTDAPPRCDPLPRTTSRRQEGGELQPISYKACRFHVRGRADGRRGGALPTCQRPPRPAARAPAPSMALAGVRHRRGVLRVQVPRASAVR
jgi:hypothetical protein